MTERTNAKQKVNNPDWFIISLNTNEHKKLTWKEQYDTEIILNKYKYITFFLPKGNNTKKI